ncbi:UNVERIFIED_CONTAM: hypothetical protein Sradi_0119400 [Sesamum radiatum]|uniref:Uncharacterized protein n=1 Tax=Sesamum radiatum TaxID=300843 RepID=A0AAW2WJ00_SESRA
MSGYPLLKKPKIEIEENEEEEEEEEPEENDDGKMEEQIRNEQEEALLALIEHRTKEVEHLRQRITYYKSQLNDAEKRLEDTQNKLVRLRGQNMSKASKNFTNGREEVKVERRSASPIHISEGSSQKHSQSTPSHQRHDTMKPSDNLRRPPSPFCRNGDSSQNQTQSRPQLVIPAVAPNMSQSLKTKESGNKTFSGSGSFSTSATPTHVNSLAKFKGEKARKGSSEQETVEPQPKGTKRNLGSASLLNPLASLRFFPCLCLLTWLKLAFTSHQLDGSQTSHEVLCCT